MIGVYKVMPDDDPLKTRRDQMLHIGGLGSQSDKGLLGYITTILGTVPLSEDEKILSKDIYNTLLPYSKTPRNFRVEAEKVKISSGTSLYVYINTIEVPLYICIRLDEQR